MNNLRNLVEYCREFAKACTRELDYYGDHSSTARCDYLRARRQEYQEWAEQLTELLNSQEDMVK